MHMRWRMLAVLFFSRLAMAFQFGSVGALGPLYETTFGIDSAALGFLIGLYVLPGLVIAIPGGAIGARFGDRRTVAVGAGLMFVGAALAAIMPSWEAQVAGRVIAGAGGVMFNVLMTKMVADWFAGREIATAMALFVNSWPGGIAAALLVLPYIAETGGFAAATWLCSLGGLGAMALIGLFYRAPDHVAASGAPKGLFPRGRALVAISLAGLAWGLFNAGLTVMFSFGPKNLVERGWSLVEAAASTSIVLWGVMLAGFAGGVLSDRSGRPMTILFVSSALMALCLVAFPQFDTVVAMMVAFGIVTGIPTGAYMSLTARSLSPRERAWGMGIFYMVYYVVFSASPWMAGALIDITGKTGAAFLYAGAVVVLAMAAVLACLAILRSPQADGAPPA